MVEEAGAGGLAATRARTQRTPTCRHTSKGTTRRNSEPCFTAGRCPELVSELGQRGGAMVVDTKEGRGKGAQI